MLNIDLLSSNIYKAVPGCKGGASLPHMTIRYTSSRYRGSDKIQGRYVFNTERFDTIRCDMMQSNTVYILIHLIEFFIFHLKN